MSKKFVVVVLFALLLVAPVLSGCVDLCDGMGSAEKIAACKNNAAALNQTAENVKEGSKVVATLQAPAPTAVPAPKTNDSTAAAIALVAVQMAAWIKKGHKVSSKMRLIASRIVLNHSYMCYWTVWFEQQTGSIAEMDLDRAIDFERKLLDSITDLRYEIGTLDWQVQPCTCEDDCACRFVHNPF